MLIGSDGSGFLLPLSEWSLPYVRCHITVYKMKRARHSIYRRIDPTRGGPIELFLVPTTTGVAKAVVCIILSVG